MIFGQLIFGQLLFGQTPGHHIKVDSVKVESGKVGHLTQNSHWESAFIYLFIYCTSIAGSLICIKYHSSAASPRQPMSLTSYPRQQHNPPV